jgi:hypothetical protein
MLQVKFMPSSQPVAYSRRSRQPVGRDPVSCQRVGRERRTSPSTEYLRPRMDRWNETKGRKGCRAGFSAYFADGARRVLAHRPGIVAP